MPSRSASSYSRAVTTAVVCSALLVTGCGRSITTDITNVVLKSPEELADVDRTPGLSLQGFEYKKQAKRTFDHLPYQYTYVNLRTGKHVGSTNERNSRRAQGIVRLYIGHYAFTKGGEKEREQARRMLLHDDNAITDELYSVFPNSISWVADKYQLDATTANNYWAYSQTSSYDVAYFLGQLLDREPDATLLAVMRERQSLNPQQNYGSGVLPNIIGSQTAESDENKEYFSASYGSDFVAVGAVNTSKTTLTDMMKYQVLGEGKPYPTETEKPSASETTSATSTSATSTSRAASGTANTKTAAVTKTATTTATKEPTDY